ncbi:hypothetical protein CLPUN_02010 [Clostridium puniceum]|uniref:Uncharacterized protein n=1 Tax=Clostridium puniceum TaxID=29367 RepID=A0A1S8TXZ9_9CLOT|nr:hypothetical protein [Clostridium puniceum]OOM82499.1 hypothetical protein CLPUN_02010 [Clostridium puniceum]
MSMPNIPNITPLINITREQAIDMIIASIAMEEMGLAHILNAEGEKIQYILDKNKCKSVLPKDIKEINQGVEKVIREIMKLQILLQEKLESIISIIPPKSDCCDDCCENISTKKCKCDTNIIGNGRGCVNNTVDTFYRGIFNITLNIPEFPGVLNQFIKYTLEKENKSNINSVILLGFPQNINLQNINKSQFNKNSDLHTITTINGNGIITLRDGKEILKQSIVNFSLTIWSYKRENTQKIKMIINDYDNLFNHNSGIMNIKSGLIKILDLSC